MMTQSDGEEKESNTSEIQQSMDQMDQSQHIVEDTRLTDVDIPPKSKWYHEITIWLLFAVFTIVLGSFSFGFVVGVLNSPEEAIRKCNTTMSDEFFPPCVQMGDVEWTAAIVMFPVGALFGSLGAGPVSDRIGRKWGLFIGHCVVIVAAFIMSFLSHFISFLIARLMIGFGIGILSVVIPLYLSEVAPANLKGAIGAVNTLFNTTGIFITQILGIFLSWQPGWRVLLAMQAIPSLLACGLLYYTPNSPMWLIQKGRDSEAEFMLKRLRKSENVSVEMDEFLKSRPVQTGEKKGWFSFWRKSLTRPLIAGIGLHISQQFSGINVVFFYSTSIFYSAGIQSASIVTAATGVVTIISNLISMYFVERFGRRMLLFIGTIIQFLSFTVLAICFIAQEYSPKVFGILSVIAVLTYLAGFSLALGPITWLMLGELFPSDVKGLFSGICSSVNWICTAFIVLTFPVMRDILGKYTFLPYVGCLLVILVFLFFLVPETRGKNPDDE
jgi:SP family facilitated glucose transporter-like MFS transporter 1